MGRTQLTADQNEAQLLISDDDDRQYSYEVHGADVRVGTNPRGLAAESIPLRKDDSGPIQVPKGVALYGELAGDGPATIDLVPSLDLGRDPRREMERPKDAAVRAGNSEIVDFSGNGLGAGSSSTLYDIAENTGPGIYRLQTINVAETSGAWDPNIRVELQLRDSEDTLKERMAGNIAQLPWDFPSPVVVPAEFTAKARVHNDSAASIDYRLSAAYTKEVME